jgi:peroxiredoxin
MFNRTHILIVLIALAGALGGFVAGGWLRAPPAPRETSAKVGTQAAPVSLPDPAGKTRSLAEWRGKLIVLNFWASWCGPCIEEMPLLDRTGKRLASRGVQVVGIAADSAAATQAFLARHPVAYPILVDDPARGHDLSLEYGNTRNVLPYSVLVGRDGRILAQRFGNFTAASLDAWLQPYL